MAGPSAKSRMALLDTTRQVTLHPYKRMTLLLLTVLALTVLAGCGQTGPLYLPDAPDAIVVSGPETPPPTE